MNNTAKITAFISHSDCEKHDMGAQHPECPSRLRAIRQHFDHSGLLQELCVIEATAADPACIERAHPGSYLNDITDQSPSEGLAYIDPDTALNPHSLDAALLAAGAAVQGVEGVIGGAYQRAFCAVRPPGHHAEIDQAMGFCVFNNVAVAALQALSHDSIERVAIIDFDVHHGNGTVSIFKDDPRVMVCSSFQYPYYPGRLQTVDRATIINTPLPAGCDSARYRRAIEQQWLPALESFKPDLLLVSAGFDAHRDDPLAQLQLVDDDYRWITEFIVSCANSHARGRIVSVLEGGYNLQALATASFQHVSTLL